jgi:hypothetical protein
MPGTGIKFVHAHNRPGLHELGAEGSAPADRGTADLLPIFVAIPAGSPERHCGAERGSYARNAEMRAVWWGTQELRCRFGPADDSQEGVILCPP